MQSVGVEVKDNAVSWSRGQGHSRVTWSRGHF